MDENINAIESNCIDQFQEKVFSFYGENKRDLPWRKTRDPYKILISEFMLQQTQVNRVIEFYNTWIDNWSTINELARTSFISMDGTWL